MRYLLGIDFGGGASKATLLGENGAILCEHTVEYPTRYPAPGACEQDPEDWIAALCENTQTVLKKANISPFDIAAVAGADACAHVTAVGLNNRIVARNGDRTSHVAFPAGADTCTAAPAFL